MGDMGTKRSLAVEEEDYYAIQELAAQWTLQSRGRKRWSNAEVVRELVRRDLANLTMPDRPTSLQQAPSPMKRFAELNPHLSSNERPASIQEAMDEHPGVSERDVRWYMAQAATDQTPAEPEHSDMEYPEEPSQVPVEPQTVAVQESLTVERFEPAALDPLMVDPMQEREEPDLDDWGPDTSGTPKWVPGARYGNPIRPL